MKTFTTTEARNKFGEFLDAGMIESVRLVRNNRVIGYFLPAREYNELTRAMAAQLKSHQRQAHSLSAAQEETLSLYSKGQISASETKADVGCDYRGLIALLAERGLALPRINATLAETMATEALAILDIPVLAPVQQNRNVHRG